MYLSVFEIGPLMPPRTLMPGPESAPNVTLPCEHIARLFRVDDNRAADGITSVERALRPFQYLDGVDVEELLVELRGVRHLHAVDEHGHRGLAVARLRNASHGHERGALVLGLHEAHVRRERNEILRSIDTGGLDIGRGKGIDRARYVERRFVATPGRDRDRFRHAADRQLHVDRDDARTADDEVLPLSPGRTRSTRT